MDPRKSTARPAPDLDGPLMRRIAWNAGVVEIRHAFRAPCQSVRMTDPTRSAPFSSQLRRWPSDPAHLVDTTLCPACFFRLGGTTCGECGLQLAVPAASDLLAAATRGYDAERERQRLITRMRAEQSVAAAPGRADAASHPAAHPLAATPPPMSVSVPAPV